MTHHTLSILIVLGLTTGLWATDPVKPLEVQADGTIHLLGNTSLEGNKRMSLIGTLDLQKKYTNRANALLNIQGSAVSECLLFDPDEITQHSTSSDFWLGSNRKICFQPGLSDDGVAAYQFYLGNSTSQTGAVGTGQGTLVIKRQATDTSTTGDPGLAIFQYGAGHPKIFMKAGRGTESVPLSCAANQLLGVIEAQAYREGTGAGFAGVAAIMLKASSNYNPSTDTCGGMIVFKTTPNGTTTSVAHDYALPRMTIDQNGKVWMYGDVRIDGHLDVIGKIDKADTNFVIDHPLDPENKNLVHSATESARNEVLYRGRVRLVDGRADVSIDEDAHMTAGTFAALTRDPEIWLQNRTGWEPLKGDIKSGTLRIVCRDRTSTDEVAWLVVAERADPAIRQSPYADANGRLMPEQPKPELAQSELADRVADEDADQDTVEGVEEARGCRGYVRHPRAYPNAQPLPTRRVIRRSR